MDQGIKQLKIAFLFFCLMTILTGFLYPGAVTLLSTVFFPWEAGGSLIQKKGKIRGSELIGQSFKNPRYFWGRPSATTPYPYNATSSNGSNLGPLNPALLDAVKQRLETLQQADPTNKAPIPIELLTASASGLDPHISPEAAFYQANRIAKIRGLLIDQIHQIIQQNIEAPQFGILGESRVNVLKLNLALDNLAP